MAEKLGAGLVLGLSFAVASLLPFALAMPKYRAQAIAQLHYAGPLWSRKTMACTFCHVNDSGGAPWNSFGEELKATWRAEPAVSFADVLYQTLAANQDGDGDGYPDALEVFAHTLPGDPDSKPTESLEALEKRFLAAGGVGQYRAGQEKAVP